MCLNLLLLTFLTQGIAGLSLLDLGSGSGQDCYVASKLVGPSGHVTGVDMTESLLAVARQHVQAYTKDLGYEQPNLTFELGYIEDLAGAGIAASSMDVVVSNW